MAVIESQPSDLNVVFFRGGSNKFSHRVHLAGLACKAVAFLYKHLVRRMQFCLQEESSGTQSPCSLQAFEPSSSAVVSRKKLHR